MDTVREALAEAVRSLPEGSLESACLAWTLVAGPVIAARTRAEEVQGKTLFVRVCDTEWLRQLEAMKPDLTRALDRVLGHGRIDNLSFAVGILQPA
jgi:predicted nucleic acid-binding Zn ribbon protein